MLHSMEMIVWCILEVLARHPIKYLSNHFYCLLVLRVVLVYISHMDNKESLAKAIVTRRLELGFETAKDLAEDAGVSSRLLSDIENGKRDTYSKRSCYLLEQALGWELGSIKNILADGGEPIEVKPLTVGEVNRLVKTRRLGNPEPIFSKGTILLELEEDILDKLDSADLKEVEVAADLAARERARQILQSRSVSQYIAPHPDSIPDFKKAANRPDRGGYTLDDEIEQTNND